MSQSINLYKQLLNHKLFNKSVKFGLKRIKLALSLLGNPERQLNNVINVLGESGKFTTLWALKSFIEANNQTVSTYISPSLQDVRERFYMGNRYLTYKEIKDTIKKIEKLKIPLTVYEVLTLVYIINASKLDVDYFILETGALWKHDCSNIFDFPLAQIVTNINLQHKIFLKKKTLNEIIKEDVGYLSHFTNIYIGKQTPYVLKKIKGHLKKNKSKIHYPKSWKLIKKNKHYYYQDKKIKIKLNTRNVHSVGMFQNISHAIKIALDLKISKKIIEKTIPSLTFPGRFNYLKKGRIKKMLHKNELIMIDGAHAPADALNLYNYLKTIKLPKYGIWSMTKNKEPDLFIKELKNVFQKIVTVPIENENGSESPGKLNRIAVKNKIVSDTAYNFKDALRKISSNEKKLIVAFGSLYAAGSILNKN
jgi:dihydrofolate synthase/folylpolyglutamate synthase